jgi:hypothetical protein
MADRRGGRRAAGDMEDPVAAAAAAVAKAAAAEGANQAAIISAAIGAAVVVIQGAMTHEAHVPDPFALAPGLVAAPTIDMSSWNGIKIWTAKTDPLEPRFDGASGSGDGPRST